MSVDSDLTLKPKVVRLWREGRTVGEIAHALGIYPSEAYRLVVLTGEMRRSIEADPDGPKPPEAP